MLFRQHVDPRRGGMDAIRHGVEVGARAGEDHDLAIEHHSLGLDPLQVRHEFGKVAGQRLLIAAVDHDLVAVFERDRAETVPLGLVLPGVAAGQFGLDLRLHRAEWRHDA